MATRRFVDFPCAEQDSAASACSRAGIPIEEFELFIDETVERSDGSRLRRVTNIARKKPNVNRTYDASPTSNWPLAFETAMADGEFDQSGPWSRVRACFAA